MVASLLCYHAIIVSLSQFLFDNQEFVGEVVGVDDSFCLQIKARDILLHIDSGEIDIIG